MITLPAGLKNRKSLKNVISNHTTFMTLWFLWTVLSGFWSLDLVQWLLQSMVVFITMVHSFYLRQKRENRTRLFRVFLLANAVHTVIAWGQIFFSRSIIPESSFYNQNFLATYLLFSLIMMIFWKTDQFSVQTPLRYLLVLSNFLLILFANSRGITVITFFILLLIFYFKMYVKELKNLFIGLLLAGFIIVTGVLLFTEVIASFITDPSTIIRLNLVQNGLFYLMESPLIGLGAGSITYLIDYYPISYTNQYTVLHNWWAGLLVTHGIIFFTLYILRYLWNGYLMANLALRTKNPQAQMIVTYFAAMIIAVMIPDSLFHSLWFWIMMTMIWSEIEQLKEEDLTIQNNWMKKIDVREYLSGK